MLSKLRSGRTTSVSSRPNRGAPPRRRPNLPARASHSVQRCRFDGKDPSKVTMSARIGYSEKNSGKYLLFMYIFSTDSSILTILDEDFMRSGSPGARSMPHEGIVIFRTGGQHCGYNTGGGLFEKNGFLRHEERLDLTIVEQQFIAASMGPDRRCRSAARCRRRSDRSHQEWEECVSRCQEGSEEIQRADMRRARRRQQ